MNLNNCVEILNKQIQILEKAQEITQDTGQKIVIAEEIRKIIETITNR